MAFQIYLYNSGGRYNPELNSWVDDQHRRMHQWRGGFTLPVWTGSEMIVWGGDDSTGTHLNTGGRYNPVSDTWTPTSVTNAPTARYNHMSIWTGNEMIVWGGPFVTGGKYDPVMDRWSPTSTVNAPAPISGYSNSAVWTGSEMIVWSGFSSVQFPNAWRKIQSYHRQLDCSQPNQSASDATSPLGHLDRPRDDRLGRPRHKRLFEHRRKIQSCDG